MHRVVVHTGAIVGAGAVVLNDTVVPHGALAVGAPAVIKEGRADSALIAGAVAAYVHRARTYPGQLRRID
jgi:carbonic anhydrase/acetyltransferase-like protein (isoleucine patch superfamily)